MSTSPNFDEAIREASRQIGEIVRDDHERQRAELRSRIRALLEMARGKVGGELAEALLQVFLVADEWHASPEWQFITAHDAADKILTAMETGLGVRTP
jgi:hypothetical protein